MQEIDRISGTLWRFPEFSSVLHVMCAFSSALTAAAGMNEEDELSQPLNRREENAGFSLLDALVQQVSWPKSLL